MSYDKSEARDRTAAGFIIHYIELRINFIKPRKDEEIFQAHINYYYIFVVLFTVFPKSGQDLKNSPKWELLEKAGVQSQMQKF